MPNWVRNIVKVPKSILPNIKEKYSVNNEFTFNKVIPMPKELMVTSGTETEKAIIYALSLKNDHEIWSLVDKFEINKYMYDTLISPDKMKKIKEYAKNYEPNKTEKELGIKTLQEFGELCINNVLKYGAKTWYDWCIENWGTKWDAEFLRLGC